MSVMSGRKLVPVKLLKAKVAPTAAAATTTVTATLRVQFPSGVALEISGTPEAQLLERLIGCYAHDRVAVEHAGVASCSRR